MLGAGLQLAIVLISEWIYASLLLLNYMPAAVLIAG
jgi:hypothetical protein